MLLWLTRRLLRSTPSPAFFAHAPSSLVVTVCHKGSQKNLKNKRVKIIKSQHTAPLSARRPPPPLPRWHCPPCALHCQIPLNARRTCHHAPTASRRANLPPRPPLSLAAARSPFVPHARPGVLPHAWPAPIQRRTSRYTSPDPEADITIALGISDGHLALALSALARSLSLGLLFLSSYPPVLRTRSDMGRKNKQSWLFH